MRNMTGSRTAIAVVGLIGSLLISVLLWWYFDSFVFFLFVPFVPFLFRGSKSEEPLYYCPSCGFQTKNTAYGYCPRDGTKLEAEK